MSLKSLSAKSPSERLVKGIRRATRKQYSAEDKIRIVLDGLRGEASIAELCRREGIAESILAGWVIPLPYPAPLSDRPIFALKIPVTLELNFR